MKRASLWPSLLVGVLIIALGVLATLQVRWIGQLSDAHDQRMRAELQGAAKRLNEELHREMGHIVSAFEMRDVGELPRRYDAWAGSSRDRRLLKAIYVLQLHPDGPSALRFDPSSHRLQPSEWPESLEGIMRQREEQPRRASLSSDIPPFVMPVNGEGGMHRTFLVLQFDTSYLVHGIVPDLARRFFSGFDVAVAHADAIVYRSIPSWPASVRNAQPDFVWPLLGDVRPEGHEPPPPWRLLVRHHGEPLAAVNAAARRRDLAIASAILVLLAASIVLLAAIARRAERLRQRQLEFVAGITHELHTPLAALASAGQNLADGVDVDTAKYGEAIVRESHRLSDLVDQVLQLGGIERGAAAPRNEDVDPRGVIEDAVAQCRWLAEERGVRVETTAPQTLPIVRGNRAAVTRAVQNLVANAVRHGSEGRWVGVRAATDDGFVAISVEDRGPGIASTDLPHLFEPFYRGRNAQVRGSGLGLTIVDRIAREHGGSITVAKRRERGAEFVLRLPVG